MLKKVITVFALSILLFQGTAFAVETEGEVIFRDALYGAAIGALLGGTMYILDQEDFGQKVGTGIIIGTVGGLIYGVIETQQSFVEIEKGKIRIAVPTPVIEKNREGLQYSASIVKTRF
jgi:hypothetical protein